MPSLHDILWNLRNEDLAKRLKLLGTKPAAPNKQGLIAALKEAYEGTGLHSMWDSLSPLEQSAVAEACHAPDLTFRSAAFAAKYGALPPFSIPKNNSTEFRSWTYGGDPTRLILFFYQFDDNFWRIPSDLATRLKAFVPQPRAVAVATLPAPPDEKGVIIRLTEQEALCEVTALLRLADQGNLRVGDNTGIPSATGRPLIQACLANGDFFPPESAFSPNRKSYEQEIGALKPVAWSRLLMAAKLVSITGGKSKLTTAGRAALKREPHEIIRDLWKKWHDNTLFDEFNRIDIIKGQAAKGKGHLTAKPPRRAAISTALMKCPVNEWIGTEAFSRYMQAAQFDFQITTDRSKLYLRDANYGNFGYSGYGTWNILQFRYILCLLFEYAATLGLVDIAYEHPQHALNDYRRQWGGDDLQWLSRYDGLRAFRITPLGACCLGLESDYRPARPTSSLVLSVMPNLRIQIHSGTPLPAESFLLEAWAEPLGHGMWRLDPARGREAVERGLTPDDLTAMLRQYDSQPLPETVAGFFKSCQADGTALRSAGEALLFDCRDAATAAMICERKDLHEICFRCGETRLAVPAAQAVRFRKAVRALGLGVI